MTITELIKEGEVFRDSINDSSQQAGKIKESDKYYLWVERVVRHLGQTIRSIRPICVQKTSVLSVVSV